MGEKDEDELREMQDVNTANRRTLGWRTEAPMVKSAAICDNNKRQCHTYHVCFFNSKVQLLFKIRR